MTTGLKGRVSLFFLAFAVVMFIFPAMAFAQDAGDSTGSSSTAPTIQSDRADYPPGATVTLTGSNWQPGESVHIYVNDDEGKTWSRDVDVTADESGAIQDQFNLPDWFVATYSVKATGSQSGVATTSFTDAVQVKVQGKSNPQCGTGGNCDGGFEGGPLTGWKELDKVPMRLKFLDAGTYSVVVSFNHATTSGNRIPGIQNLVEWSADTTSGVKLDGTPQLDSSDAANWKYTVKVIVTKKDALLNFNAKLAAGSHAYPGSALDVRIENTIGVNGDVAQISKPGVDANLKPDLAVTKAGPTSAAPGSTITYTLSYQNKTSAVNQATGVELTDVLPSGVTYVPGSCSNGCTVQGNEVIWNLSNLAVGQTGSQTLSVQIPAGAASGTTYTNNAQILSAENDASINDNYSSLTTSVNKVNGNPNAVDDSLTTDEDTAGSVNVLSNDTDPDNDALSVSNFTQPTNGTVTQNLDNTLKYEPKANFNGTDSFTYTVSDGKGGTATGTVNITVNPVNDAPKATDDSYNVDEDQPLTVAATDGVLKNDTDVENNPLTAAQVAGPTKGALTLNANGSFTYTPNKDFNGTDSFSYKANDGQADSNVATVTITVKAVNDAPVAQDDSATTDEDKAIASIPVLSNDSDVDGDSLSVSGFDTTSAQGGTVTKNTDRTLRYAPAADFNGSDSFSYTASDGRGGTATAKVTITVNADNDAPSFTKGADHTSNEDAPAQSVSGWASAISAGPNESGQNVSFVVTNDNNPLFSAQPAVASDGTLTYKSDADKNGSATVTVKTKDDGGTPNEPSDDLASGEQTFTITVRPVNDAPSFKIGADQTVDEDAGAQTVPDFATGISRGPADESGQSVSFTRTSNTNSALFSAQPEISAEGTLTYTPAANANGEATVSFKIQDTGGTDNGGVNESAAQSFKIAVSAVNDAPVAADDSAETSEDNTITSIEVLKNDSDVDGDDLSVSETTQSTNGTVTINDDGKTLKYVPNTDSNGEDSFTYTVSDGKGGTATAKVTITVSAVNDAPVATDGSATTPEDTAKAITLNASDVEHDSLTYTIVDGPTHGQLSGTGANRTYTPAANYNGPDSFTFRANDGSLDSNVATVSITVTAVNDEPVAENDSVNTDEDTAANIDVLANDSDVDGDDLSVVSASLSKPDHGTVELITADGPNKGKVLYTPAANFNGTDSFTYKATDDTAESNVATVTITVKAVNDAPVANDLTGESGQVTTPEDTPKTITLEASDVDSDNLTFSIVNGPTKGSLSGSGTNLTYTPNKDFNGSDFFTFKVCDDSTPEPLCDEGRIDINVAPVNDAPVAEADEYIMGEDGTLTVVEAEGVLGNDSDVDDGDELTATLKSGPANGTLTLNPDGSFTYTPNADFNGEDSFTYTVSDGNNGTADATVKVTIVAVNDAPVAVDDTKTTDEDMATNIAVITNDTDVDNANAELSVSSFSQAAHGTVSRNSDGTLKYEPNANFNGTDAFTYKAKDASLDSNEARVTITVTAVNDAPVARDDTATTPEDTPVVILAADLFQNDSTGPANESGQKLTITQVSGATHGQAEINSEGNVIFTPAANYAGDASFDYTVCDDGGTANGGVACFQGTATVKVTVSAVNDAPVATPDSATTDEDTATDIAVLANDTDVENDGLTALKVTDPAHGTVTAGPNGTLTYTPAANFNGTDSFTYKANDGDLDSEVVTVTVTVTPVNDDPKAVYDAYYIDEDETLTIAAPGVLGNDSDVDGDSLTATQVVGTGHGQVTLNADGSFTYKPDADYYGPDSFSYKANDGNLDSNVAIVDITVKPVNDLPVISSVIADGTPVNEGSPATIKVTATDKENQASDLRYSFDCDNNIANGYEKGPQAADNATCTFDDNGTYRVNVRVSDSDGGSATDSTSVSVRNVAPTLTGPITVSPQQALLGQKVTFTAPNPFDPSQADTKAGFTWNWYANDATTPFLTGLGLNPLVSNQFSANKCGTYSVSATATDKDGGVSNAARANASVNVSNGVFRAPLVDGTTNMVQKGQVVPVKVFVGCGTTTLTGLTPSIQLLKGNVTPEDESQYTTVTASVSSADTEGWMRPIDGGYIYNLRVPDAAAGAEFSIRVNPFGTTATPNPAGSQMYSLIKIRK